MDLSYYSDYWIEQASEDELRDAENELRSKMDEIDSKMYELSCELDNLDQSSDQYILKKEEYDKLDREYSDIWNVQTRIVQEISSSRFEHNLPKHQHGWYLPEDED